MGAWTDLVGAYLCYPKNQTLHIRRVTIAPVAVTSDNNRCLFEEQNKWTIDRWSGKGTLQVPLVWITRLSSSQELNGTEKQRETYKHQPKFARARLWRQLHLLTHLFKQVSYCPIFVGIKCMLLFFEFWSHPQALKLSTNIIMERGAVRMYILYWWIRGKLHPHHNIIQKFWNLSVFH